MALASRLLGAVLSSEAILQATLLQAFWIPEPLDFKGAEVQPVLPLHRYDRLSCSANLTLQTPEQQRRMQELVLAQRWCTFSRLDTCFSMLLSAVCQDVFHQLNLSLRLEDQHTLNNLITHPPRQCRMFETMSLDGSEIILEYDWPLSRSARVTYIGTDDRFDNRRRPNLEIEPTVVLTLPDSCLHGGPWTDSKIQTLRILGYGVDMQQVKFSTAALHAGMKNAILEGNTTALLVLVWTADRISQSRAPFPHEAPFEIPPDLFRLAISNASKDDARADALAISSFTLLLRTHAESMPKRDKTILAWASYLLSKPGTQTFGQWLMDFSSRFEENEYIRNMDNGLRYGFSEEWEMIRRPLFRDGRISYKRKDDEVIKGFVKIDGRGPKGFGQEIEDLHLAVICG